ncbi:MAG: outer membrane protein assembly factor BamA [Candidatus Nitricoxidivorans perseverans]|uniref:Outer membrane protein assembly factor BamA n=1 Tax=Candidatus Nitricoxidivorans perseverans TaxID=2975601 RepID=A0AA49J083_9PROT|nr:MAG: outer membrane protein assembly factor BamA [Candidatus Nitricoxidivorans perseverans]
MKKSLIAGLLATLFAAPALAFEPFTVKDIRVEGIQRTEAGTVFGYLPVKVGDTMTDDKAARAIKSLFATGFFKDVRLEIENGVLVVLVEERPAIAAVDFTGIKAFDKDQLKKGLREVGLAESRIFDRALVEKAEQELKRQYLSQGHYAVQVTTTVTPLERNRVGINFAVDEGEIAKIRQINIIGAAAFKEADLLDLFVLRTPGWLTWYTKNDQYSKQKLSGDLESLRSWYLDRGYLEFNVESTQVSISRDKQDIYITININEGEKYTVSSVKLAGELLLPEAELTKLVTIKPNEPFSREKLTETTKAISERLGNEGYAFANVNAAPELDKEKRLAAFTIYIDPGRRVYVRRIGVAGNTRTRDEVIRREMRQMEASWYDGEKINKSRSRVDRLGYFDEVTVETPAVAGTTDQVDLNVNVKERPTGSMMIGAGFSSTEKFVLSGSVQQQNLFGSGKHVGVSINTSKSNQVYSFSYTDPYHTIDGISRGFDVYKRDTDTDSLTVGTYGSSSMGAGVRYGLPISDDDSVNFGLSADATKLKLTTTSPQRYQDYVNEQGASNTTLLATAGWARDTLDSRIYPTTGNSHRIGGELALPGGKLRYYRATYQHQRFIPVGRKYTLALNGEIGIADGMGGKPLPFFKNFYAGGVSSVRGYEGNSLGPVDAATDERLGGSRRLIGSAEFLVPMPGMGLDKSMRVGLFLDAGQVWGIGEKLDLGDLRYATGVSAIWNSPMGPLKFSVATPLNKSSTDKVQRLQFQMGSTF